MAYIPDPWVIKRLEIALSAQQVLFYYCARANQDTGETIVSVERTSQDLGIRKDHINEHDRKLVREGYIRIAVADNGGRMVQMLAPWLPRGERGQRVEKADTSQNLGELTQNLGGNAQDLGSPLNSSPKLGEIPQNLGKSAQNLGNFTQDLGAHIGITSSCNQPMGPERASLSPFEEFKSLFPGQESIHAETVIGAAGIADPGVWRATLEAWKLNRYSERNLSGMIDSYKKRLEQSQKVNGYDQERERRAKRSLERSRTDLAVKYGHKRPE